MNKLKKSKPIALLVGALLFGLTACGGDSSDVAYDVKMGDFTPPSILGDIPGAVSTACQSGGLIDEVKKRGTLNWAIGVSPPFGFKLEDGTWAGVEAQAAAELAKILGVKFEITDYSYDILPNTVVTGQADIIGAQLFATDTRKEVIDFSEAYYLAGQLFYVLADSTYQTIDDLNKAEVRFVYGTGGGQGDLGKKYIPNSKISDAPLRGQLLPYDFLAAGQADATMTEAAPMKVIFDKFPDPALAAIGKNGRVTGDYAADDDIIDPFSVAFGFKKDDAAWKGCIDAWVSELKSSGAMAARLDYWLAQNIG